MSTKLIIENAVRVGFAQMTDLKREMTFLKKGAETFDFAEREVVGPAASSVKADAVIVRSRRASTSRRVMSRQLLVEVAKVGDVPLYDSVVDGKTQWNIADIEYVDDFIAILNIYREANIDG